MGILVMYIKWSKNISVFQVTIRAYALQGKQYYHQESSGRGDLRPSKVIDVPSAPQKPEPKKKPVESLMKLLTKFQMR